MKLISIALLFCICLLACKKETHKVDNSMQQLTPGSPTMNFSSASRYAGADYSQAISIGDANQLISSYLSSINYAYNDTTLRSFTFDADTLRSYLNDTTHGKIVTLKFFVAHQPGYIAVGNFGKNAGLDSRAITLVLAGLDEENNYIYNRHDEVYEHFMPCPSNCMETAVLLE